MLVWGGALRHLSRNQGVTLFTVLLAAFKILLYRYSSQSDIVVGSPNANRSRVELENIVGYFANTLALRTDLSGNPRLSELLLRIQETVLEAHAHQQVPLDTLVEALRVKRNPSYSPLFQTTFSFQNTPRRVLPEGNLAIAPIESSFDVSRYDISLLMWDESPRLVATLNYNSDLFVEETMQVMQERYVRLLRSMVADPSRKILDLSVQEADEFGDSLKRDASPFDSSMALDASDDEFDFGEPREEESISVLNS